MEATAVQATPTDPDCERCGRPKSRHIVPSRYGPHPGYFCASGPFDDGPTFRRRVADMPADGVAPHLDVPLGLYRHYKGGLYRVTGGAFLATGEDDRILVVYCPAEGHAYQSVRTIEDFLGKLWDGERTAPRFAFLGPGDEAQ